MRTAGRAIPCRRTPFPILLYPHRYNPVRSDWFSSQVKTVSRPSAASRLIASPFNTIFFHNDRGRSSRAFARMTPDSVRARACAYRSPFFRHLRMIFHNIRTTLRSERGNNRPSLSALSSHCKHGFSVRIIQSLLTFSGAFVRLPLSATAMRVPLCAALRAIFHNILDWVGRTLERVKERFRRSAHFIS